MTTAHEPVPPVIPMISYEDPAAAADWLVDAFGFEDAGRWGDPDGRVTHVNLKAGDGMVMLGHPSDRYESPRRHAESCASAREWTKSPYIVDGVLVYVDDVRAHHERAVRAGAVVLTEVEDDDTLGQRQYRVEDVEGHRWMFAELLGQNI